MRKGYSGVAIYTKDQPIKVMGSPFVKDFEKVGGEFFDNEGRSIIAEYKNFYLMNCY
jgi:exonuclease III